MNTKKKTKKLTTTNADLKKSLAEAKRQLTKTDTKLGKANDQVKRLKKEAGVARTAASRSDAKVQKLQKKLDRAAAAPVSVGTKPVVADPVQADPVQDDLVQADPIQADPAESTELADETPDESEVEATTDDSVPDESWTVVQLRSEVKARGLAGLSNKPKAQLLAALSSDS